MFVFVIIKVYDELGCKWENVKTIPLLRKNKEFQTTVQNNYYYNNNNTLETKTRFCSNCGISINNYKINSHAENIPKFCSNCGFLLNENSIERNPHKEWPFHN
jgi:ribosomal protein S27AE